MSDISIIVGLGNPGPRFADTRHNVGWRVLDLLSEQLGIALNERRPKAVLGAGYFAGRRVVLAKPRTFMNNSGEAVEYLLARFGGGASALLVVYDENGPAAWAHQAAGRGERRRAQRHPLDYPGGGWHRVPPAPSGDRGAEAGTGGPRLRPWEVPLTKRREPSPTRWSVRRRPPGARWKRTSTLQ